MKSILALIALAGAAVASPLRGNVMSPRFAEVQADVSLESAYDLCKADQVTKGLQKNALDAACALVPSCALIVAGEAAGAKMAATMEKMKTEDNYPALKLLLEKETKEGLALLVDEANWAKGGMSKFAKVLQAVSPNMMRQCMACVLGAPKGAFGQMLTAAGGPGFDSWSVVGTEAKDVCTIGLDSGPFSGAHFIDLGKNGKKKILMDAYVDTIGGSARYLADVKMSVQANLAKVAPDKCELIFESFSTEVVAARNFWGAIAYTGKPTGCKLIKADQKDFAGSAWSGECK